MIIVVLAMVPALLFGMWNTGYQHFMATGETASFMDQFLHGALKVLPLVVVSYAAGLTVEFIFAIINKHQVNEGFLVSGMLIPLCLPVEIPLWMVAVATIFAVVIGKEVFGGTGMNILNVALTARAFLFFAYPTWMSGDKVWISEGTAEAANFADGSTGATLLAQATEKSSGFVDAAGAAYGDTFWSAFMGFIPGSIGETSTIAILIGAVILLATGIGSWKIMLSGVLGAFTMGLIFNAFAVNPFMEVPAHYHLVMGGFAFGIVFMATDPVTAAQTSTGKYVYGFLIGILGIMIRVFNPAYPEGIMLAILFMNVMAPLVDHYVVQANINRRQKRAVVIAA
jgi:Na+-transporting NADH:ubiquinone oxidoreductase subunit B